VTSWEAVVVITQAGVPDDHARLEWHLAAGWEPFAGAVGPGGHHWFLRRQSEPCDFEHPHPEHPCGKDLGMDVVPELLDGDGASRPTRTGES